MASKHQLSLELPDTNNIKVLRIFDTSIYADGIGQDCGTLSITSPGFNLPVNIEMLPGFNTTLTACTLGLQKTGCSDNLQPIPDGIYVINYSLSPNSIVQVEYNYLRVTQTVNRYYNLLCELEMSACEPGADVKEKLEESNDSFVSEDGDVEKWVGGLNEKRVLEALDKTIEHLEKMKK